MQKGHENHIHVTVGADGAFASGKTEKEICGWRRILAPSGAPTNVAECVVSDAGYDASSLREDGIAYLAGD